ncbi:MAG: type IX secretion system sortase PorU [bacterium]|nr:type IX secretion system sortase PorU [bacterium]
MFSLLVASTLWAAQVQVVVSTAERLHVKWAPGDAVRKTEQETLAELFPSAEWLAEEGRLIPVQTLLVACPVGTAPRVSLIDVTYGDSDLLLPDADIRADRGSTPANTLVLAGRERWRGFQIAQLKLRLAEGTPSGTRVLASAEFEVRFEGRSEVSASTEREVEALRALTLNGSIASRWWALPSGSDTPLDDGAEAWPEFDLYKLGLSETGLYSMTTEWLQSQGIPVVGVPSTQLKIYGNGGKMLSAGLLTVPDSVLRENALLIEDGGDGRMDAGDRVLFYGEGLKGFDYADGSLLGDDGHASPYSTENVYWIGIDPAGQAGKRMEFIPEYSNASTQVSSTVGRSYLDQEQFIYASGAYQSNSGIKWFMATLDGQSDRTFSISLDGASTGGGSLRLRGVGSGVSGFFDVRVNGAVVSSGVFSDPLVIQVPSGTFANGNNVIQLSNRSVSGQVLLNYIEVEYARSLATSTGALEVAAPQATNWYGYQLAGLSEDAYILDISHPLEPRVGRGTSFSDSSYSDSPRRYYATSPVVGSRALLRVPVFRGRKSFEADDYARLRDPQNEAGMIIITYDAWYEELEPLAEIHESYEEEPLRTVRVKLSHIFDEFSWGVVDPVAIRNFLRYTHDNWRGQSRTAEPPQYVLFVGDGDYDYRNLLSSADDNWMPPWEDVGNCTDDFYVDFDSGAPLLDMMSGRWPVQNAQELTAIIDKTIEYATRPLYGPWKNTATFVADDEWKEGHCSEEVHTDDSENLISDVLPEYFTFRKLYEILYPFRQSSSTSQKPDGTRDLIETINSGTLLVNYVGHGNERVWTDEQMFVMDRDFPLIDNPRTWPVIVAGTCTWGGFDRPNERCFPELLLAGDDRGAIACIAATRFTFVSQNQRLTEEFYTEIFRQGISSRTSLGQALRLVKPLASGNKLYHVLGDPALRLATPEYFAHVDSLDDSLQAGALFHLSGFVSRTNDSAAEVRHEPNLTIDNEVWADFQGVVEARVFDSEDSAAYYFPLDTMCSLPSPIPYYYGLPGNAIFRGRSSIENGRFNVTFLVPRDIQYGGDNAKVSLYFFGKADSESDSADGIGIERPLRIANAAAAVTDSVPPHIEVWLENNSFRDGDQVSRTPALIVKLSDDSGLNLSGEVGHRITVRIDEAQAEDLTQFFNYDIDSYVQGELVRSIGPLSEGEHRLTVEAWDSFNNLNTTSLNFIVGQAAEEGYAIRDVLNWPNPMSGETYFTYALTQDGTSDVNVRIYTMTGKLVDEIEGLGTRQLYNSNSDRAWNGRDREGHELANGVYFYKIIARHQQGYEAEATGKLVILR